MLHVFISAILELPSNVPHTTYIPRRLGGTNPDTTKPDSPEILALQDRKKEGEIAENSLVISPALDYIEENYMHQASSQILPAFHQVCIHSQTHCTDDSGVLAQCRSHHIL